MVYKLKCKQCGNICTAMLEQIEANDFYKCPSCGNTMDYHESTRLSYVTDLKNFELIEIYESDLDTFYIDKVIENDLNRIKEIIQNGDKEVSEKLSNIVNTIYLIINNGDLKKISKLNDVIHNLFLKSIDEGNEETNKLLGIISKSSDDFIDYINGYISCYKLKEKIIAKFKNMYRQYDGDYEFLHKIGGIAYNKAHYDC